MNSAVTETVIPCQTTATQLVEDLGFMLDALHGIASRLEFIEGGLEIEDPNPRGAALALEAAEVAVLDLAGKVEEMSQGARKLAGVPTEMAGGEVPHA